MQVVAMTLASHTLLVPQMWDRVVETISMADSKATLEQDRVGILQVGAGSDGGGGRRTVPYTEQQGGGDGGAWTVRGAGQGGHPAGWWWWWWRWLGGRYTQRSGCRTGRQPVLGAGPGGQPGYPAGGQRWWWRDGGCRTDRGGRGHQLRAVYTGQDRVGILCTWQSLPFLYRTQPSAERCATQRACNM